MNGKRKQIDQDETIVKQIVKQGAAVDPHCHEENTSVLVENNIIYHTTLN